MLRILVIGHLYVDRFLEDKGERVEVGGTGYNAARAFQDRGLETVLLGRVGRDEDGALVRRAIQAAGLREVIGEDPLRPTGRCEIAFDSEGKRRFRTNRGNANLYEPAFISVCLEQEAARVCRMVFLAGHCLAYYRPADSRALVDSLQSGGRTLLLDLVPHSLYETLDLYTLQRILGGGVPVLIGEFLTMMRFIAPAFSRTEVEEGDWEILFDHFPAEVLVVRSGFDNISCEEVRRRRASGSTVLRVRPETGYHELPAASRKGFGDRLTADFVAGSLPWLAGLARSSAGRRGA